MADLSLLYDEGITVGICIKEEQTNGEHYRISLASYQGSPDRFYMLRLEQIGPGPDPVYTDVWMSVIDIKRLVAACDSLLHITSGTDY